MRLTHLTVKNYRALKEISIPLSRFGCLIGKNNAGKSTVLQALSLFHSGSKLQATDFFDPDKEISISISIEDIGEADLNRLEVGHRERIAGILDGGKLTLVRQYERDEKSKLVYERKIPKDTRFHFQQINDLVGGKRGKQLLDAAIVVFPELEGKIQPPSSATQSKVKEEIQKLEDDIPEAEKMLSVSDLPTGMDSSIKPMLPEPIYIAAVKNLADEVKAKEATPFGKVLAILLEAIEPKLEKVKELFAELSAMFNRVVKDDGTVLDGRLDEVKKIETTVEKFLKESFANVSLEIHVPPPEIKDVLSSAQLTIDDGVAGSIDTKGDGLRRATVFAILRSYVMLKQGGHFGTDVQPQIDDRHFLLFEEPELYLHPSAQRVLFEALRVFSQSNHVMITTHSPTFFGPKGTATFTKLWKSNDQKPSTLAHVIDLSQIKNKDQFQIICYENNNAAFFYDKIVLVEGDSDFIVLPHLASLTVSPWQSIAASFGLVRLNGKHSIKRYKDFFSRCNVSIAVVSDLDLLINGFDAVGPSAELKKAQGQLLSILDSVVQKEGGFSEVTDGKVKDAHAKTALRGLWEKVKKAGTAATNDPKFKSEFEKAVGEFFSWEKYDDRLRTLRTSKDPDLITAKRQLLKDLRAIDVFVLERGELENYYPVEITVQDKPTMAQEFCKQIATREHFDQWQSRHCTDNGKELRLEIQSICAGVFK